MVEDVAAEDRALAHYAKTLALVGESDAELTELIERIVADERHHHVVFERLTVEVRAAGDAAYVAHPIAGPEDIAVIGPTIGTEYQSVLQYLWNKYGCNDCERGEQYFEFAVDEMRHLGWVASYVAGLGDPVPPDVPSERVRAVGSTADARKASGALEKTVAAFYPPMIDDAKSEGLREDLARALGQHDFHRKVLRRMG
jgi:rubrerythrin